jgi:uncharacterized lipoprotein
MKRILLTIGLAFFLSSCAAEIPRYTDLHPALPERISRQYAEGGGGFTITGQDARPSPDVVTFALGDNPVIRLINRPAPSELLADLLSLGWQKLGLLAYPTAPTHLTVIVDTLLVEVTRPKALFKTVTKTKIRLLAEKEPTTLTRTFSRENSGETLRRPELPALEKGLNDQMSDIIAQILADPEIRAAIDK